MSISINGVPYTDTMRFHREVVEVVERDVDNIWRMLTEMGEMNDEGDDDALPFMEPMRLPSCDLFTGEVSVRRLKSRTARSKRKEVK